MRKTYLPLQAGSYGLTVPRLQHQIKSGIALRRAASAESDLAFTDWKKGSSNAVLLGGAPRRRTVAGADADYMPRPVPASGGLRGQQQQQRVTSYPQQEQQQVAGHAESMFLAPYPVAEVAVDVPWLQTVQEQLQQQQQQSAAQPMAVSNSRKEVFLGETVLSAPVSTCELSHVADSPEALEGSKQTSLADTVQEDMISQSSGHQQQHQDMHRLSALPGAAGPTSTLQPLGASKASDAVGAVLAESPSSRLLRRPPSAPGQPSAAAWMAEEQEQSLGISYPSVPFIGSPVKRGVASPFECPSGQESSVGSPSYACAAAAGSIGQSASRECLAGEGAGAATVDGAESLEEQEGFLAITWEVFKGAHHGGEWGGLRYNPALWLQEWAGSIRLFGLQDYLVLHNVQSVDMRRGKWALIAFGKQGYSHCLLRAANWVLSCGEVQMSFWLGEEQSRGMVGQVDVPWVTVAASRL
jgi:hypothetical protein